MTKTCPECGLSLQGRDNESETCSDCLLEESLSNSVSKDDMSVSDKGTTDEQYKEKEKPIMTEEKRTKPAPYYVVWCRKLEDSWRKFEMTNDCFFNYEDAKEKYDKLYNNSDVENLKIAKVIEEKETGVIRQQYYA